MTRFFVGACLLAAGLFAWRLLAPMSASPGLDPAIARQLADLGYADWVDIPGDQPPPRIGAPSRIDRCALSTRE